MKKMAYIVNNSKRILLFSLVFACINVLAKENIPNPFGNSVVYTPNENFYGTDSFTFTVSDGVWTSGVGVVTINVLAVNDAPILGEIGDQVVDEDGVFVYDIFALDIDGDELFYSAEIDGSADMTLDGNDLVITPYENFNGEINVQVQVSDGELSDSQDFTLTVNPVSYTHLTLPTKA